MPTKLTQKQGLIIFGGILLAIILGVVVYLNVRPVTQSSQANLTIWGTEDAKGMKAVIDAYSSVNRGVQVKYVQVNSSAYRTTLLSALAAGTGPDIFEIGDHELPQWWSLTAPLPTAQITTFNRMSLESDFPSVVEQDFTSGGQIYALPFYIDTLGMVYNKDLMDSAGIAILPKTWSDFQADVPKLRVLNGQGQITQAAAAIGGSETSIAVAPDLLSLLMIQNGTSMVNANHSAATFANDTGIAAFNFYLQFGNAASSNYTWSDAMGDSLANFVQGKTAIIFTYKAGISAIKNQAPFLNIGVAPMLQPSGATLTINYPRYTGFAVSRAGQIVPAWNFLINTTAVPSYEKIYTDATGEPPALRAMIAADAADPSDPTLAVFAGQALSARSWYEADDAKMDQILNDAIENVLDGSADSTKALEEAQQSASQLMVQ